MMYVKMIDSNNRTWEFNAFDKWNTYKTGWKLMETYGAGEILLTSMDCDGTKKGYDLKLNRNISESLTIPLIASGGAGTLDHLFEGITEGKADAVLAASIFHFKEFTIEETKRYLKSKGIPVRI